MGIFWLEKEINQRLSVEIPSFKKIGLNEYTIAVLTWALLLGHCPD